MNAQRRSKKHPAFAGDRVRLRVELSGRTPDGTLWRGESGLEGRVDEVRDDGMLVLVVGKYSAVTLADPSDVDVLR